MTLPVPNLRSRLVDAMGVLLPPWNSFFQQLVQPAPEVVGVNLTGSPFSFTANAKGTLIVTGGTVSNISLIRGAITINLTGQKVIPISINDTVKITYTVAPTLQFLGS